MLLNQYGIRVKSVQLRNIDPPEDWRATTLAPYKAQRERDAAKYQTEASAILFDDTNQALTTWLKGQRATKHNPTQAQIEAKQDELRQRALAKTPGNQLIIHVKGLENATTAMVGGGGAGAGVLLGGGKKGKRGKDNNGRGKENLDEGRGVASDADFESDLDDAIARRKKS